MSRESRSNVLDEPMNEHQSRNQTPHNCWNFQDARANNPSNFEMCNMPTARAQQMPTVHPHLPYPTAPQASQQHLRQNAYRHQCFQQSRFHQKQQFPLSKHIPQFPSSTSQSIRMNNKAHLMHASLQAQNNKLKHRQHARSQPIVIPPPPLLSSTAISGKMSLSNCIGLQTTFKVEQTTHGCIAGRSYTIKDANDNILLEAVDNSDCFEQRSWLCPPFFSRKTLSMKCRNLQGVTLLRFELPTKCLLYCNNNEICVFSNDGSFVGKVYEENCYFYRTFTILNSHKLTIARLVMKWEYYTDCSSVFIKLPAVTNNGSHCSELSLGDINSTTSCLWPANVNYVIKLDETLFQPANNNSATSIDCEFDTNIDSVNMQQTSENDEEDLELKALLISAVFLIELGKGHTLFNMFTFLIKSFVSLCFLLSIIVVVLSSQYFILSLLQRFMAIIFSMKLINN